MRAPAWRRSATNESTGKGSRARGVASAPPRFRERALANRRRPWRRVGWAVGVLATLALLVWVIWFSPLLSVRSVAVSGVGTSQQQAIRNLAGVREGTPLARVGTTEVQERIRTLPTLADARVERSWPSTLRIKVVLRTPALILKNPQGQLQVVDSSGVAYTTVTKAPAGVPVVTAKGVRGTTDDAVRAALSVIDALPEDLARQVSSISVSSADLVDFKLGAVSVIWGGKDEGPRKVAVLQALLRTKPAIIDVSAPDTPVTR